MNLRQKIDELIQKIDKMEDGPPSYLLAILTHLDRAEHFYDEGQQTGDENNYTDVIYRCNQVFEGIVRTAYQVFDSNPKKDISTSKIEEYLLKHEILRPRVLDLFSNYRREWRNPSTHDHKLVFKADEAFLAIVSVSAFTFVLLEQIHEELIRELTASVKPIEMRNIESRDFEYTGSKFLDTIIFALVDYLHDNRKTNNKDKKEYEISGEISAYLTNMNPKLEIKRDMRFELEGIMISPDFIIKLDDQVAVVELKKNRTVIQIDKDREQLINYLWVSNTRNGILFYYNGSYNDIETKVHSYEAEKQKYSIVEIY